MSRSSYDQIQSDIEEDLGTNNPDDTMSSTPSSNHDKVVIEFYRVKVTLGQLKYFTFMVTGMALLWPWNCFLSASEYFGERLSSNDKLSTSYSSTMMTISTVTSLCGNFVLSQRQKDVDYTKRLKLGQVMTIAIFALLGISCVLKTDINVIVYFVFIMCMVFLSAIATASSQNGTMALVNVLGAIYANGVVVGQSVSGVLPSITLIVSVLGSSWTKAKRDSVESGAGIAMYFFTSCLVSVASLVCFKLVEHFDDQSYEELLQEPIVLMDNTSKPTTPHQGPQDEVEADEDAELEQLAPTQDDAHVSFGYLWSKLKLIVITIFLTFSITLVFPVFASTVQSTNFNSHPDSKFLNKQVFVPFIFLIWNIGDFVGRVLCAWRFFKVSNPRILIAYAISRSLIIPFFFLCNIKNRGAVIDSDLFYILLQFLFGLTNGQLCSSCFMDVGASVQGENEQKAAGGFTAVFLSTGLAFGSVLSYLFVWAINH